ncbi:MAG: AsmA-like C-terminal region-containing protein, partial [Catalinimonas sp.]
TPTAGETEAYRFAISPRLSGRIDCDVGQVRFRRFDARRVTGRLSLRDRVARVERLALQTGGGQIAASLVVDARRPDAVEIQTRGRVEQLAVDSLFWAFENFGQDFLRSDHLRGRLSATVNAFLVADRELNVSRDRLTADAAVTITDGQLNDFAPMQSLSLFIKREELANLRFSRLENHVRIARGVISVPEMSIRSNAADLEVAGTHTFDQQMDYRLRVVMASLRRPDPDAVFGQVEDDGLSNAAIPLTIRGTSDDFKVAYDGGYTRNKLAAGLKREGEELRSLFGGKQREAAPDSAAAPAPDEGEYFEF